MSVSLDAAGSFLLQLFAIQRREDSGVLTCRGDDEHAQLFFVEGRLVFVEQARIGRTLGARLVQDGDLTQAEYENVARAVRANPGESPLMTFVEQAVSMGYMGESRSLSIVQAQVERNFLRCLEWRSMAQTFTADRDPLGSRPMAAFEVEPLVLTGLRHRYTDAKVARELLRLLERYPRLTEPAESLRRKFGLSMTEASLLGALDPHDKLGKTIGDRDLDDRAAFVIVALHVCGKLRLATHPDTSEPRMLPRQDLRDGREPSVRFTLEQPTSDAERRARDAFLRGLGRLREDVRGSHDDFLLAANLAPIPVYNLMATWTLYVVSDEGTQSDMMPGLEQMARSVADRDPTCAYAFYVIGVLHARQGLRSSAILALRRALRLDPDLREAATALTSVSAADAS